MSLATQFATLGRVGELRLMRRKRVVEDAARALEAATQQRARTDRLLVIARDKARAAEDAFRAQPGSAHRLFMRDLTQARVAEARDACVVADDLCASATAQLRNGRLALSQEETRSAQIAAVARRELTKRRDSIATREEEDRWTSPQPV